MQDINIPSELIKKLIEANLPKLVEEALANKYDSPLKKAVDEAVKSNEGVISKFVNEIVTTALSDPDFKKRVGDAVITKVLTAGLTR
jgi:hypothetical protein